MCVCLTDFGTPEPYDFNRLEYTQACDSSFVKAMLGPMMTDLSTVSFIAGPYGGMLRWMEGIDSLRNVIGSVNAHNTTEVATALVCGAAQLGGLLFAVFSILVASLLCICAPIGATGCLFCWRRCCKPQSKFARQREEAIDRLLARSARRVKLKPRKTEVNERTPLVDDDTAAT